jgi:xanthosine utilization system XapX-like protein
VHRRTAWRTQIAPAVVLVVVLALYVFYFVTRLIRGPSEPGYLGFSRDLIVALTVGIAVTAIVVTKLSKAAHRYSAIPLVAMIGILGVKVQAEGFHWRGDRLASARDFLEVQLWAKEKTPPGTIFAMDPTHAYGWRGFSERPSFGTLREWLYISVLYQKDRSRFEEGKRRYAAFGLDLTETLGFNEPLVGYYRAYEKINALYCGMDERWFAKMVSEFNVRYFVFDKSNCTGAPKIPIVFENRHFFVGRARSD